MVRMDALRSSGTARGFALALLLTASYLSLPKRADACSYPGFARHELDVLQRGDAIAPVLTAASIAVTPPDLSSSSSCGDLGRVKLVLTANDDRTPQDKLGYVVTLADGGSLPTWLAMPSYTALANGAAHDSMLSTYDASAPVEDLDLAVRAVDLNGNLSEPMLVKFEAPRDSGGCSAGVRGGPAFAGLLALAALLGRRRRPQP